MPSEEELKKVQRLLDVAEGNLHQARNLLLQMTGGKINGNQDSKPEVNVAEGGEIVEGIFDGKKMMTPDNREFQVPENYASKSKLVEGDALKLTIADDGSFIFKQVGPVNRRKVLATLEDNGGQFSGSVEGKKYKLLKAAVSFFNLKSGDKVTIIIPQEGNSEWAAIDSVVEKSGAVPESKNQGNKPIPPKQEKKEKGFELPESNKIALEKLRESILNQGGNKPIQEAAEEPEIEIIEPPKKVEEVHEEEKNIKPVPAPQEDVETETLIKKQDTYDPVTEGDDSMYGPEKEENALGEELKKSTEDKRIEELEI